MRLLVYHNENIGHYIRQYGQEIMSILPGCTIVEMDLEHIDWIRNLQEINYVEKDFIIKVSEQLTYRVEDQVLIKEGISVLMVYIGKRLPQDCVDLYYEINTKKTTQGSRMSIKENRIINVVADKGAIKASCLLEGLKWLSGKVAEYNMPLMLYSTLEIPDKKETYRSFIQRSVHAMNKQGGWRVKTLYQDNFYNQLPNDEIIYVPLNMDTNSSDINYEKLGFEESVLLDGMRILRGPKSKFDEFTEQLKPKTMKNYCIQVLTRAPIEQFMNTDTIDVNLRGRYITAKGENVYIGIIGVDGIDYNQDVFKTKDGKTRVAYIWEQEGGANGKSYYASDINEMMGKVQVEDSEFNTMLLGVAAGKTVNDKESYIGLAIESELLVGKIKKAPYNIQKVYSGNYSEDAVLIEDVLFAVQELINFSLRMKKPLVLIIPYGTNLSSHDGSLEMEVILAAYGRQSGVTIIVPAGEEADKQHHCVVTGESKKTVDIIIAKEKQNVLLSLWSQFPDYVEAVLYIRYKKDFIISLQDSQEIQEGDMRVWVRGSKIRFENGCQEMLVRMENLEVGTYRLEIKPIFFIRGRVDIWLTQYPVNAAVTVNPSTPFVGIPSLGNIGSIICVGTYDNRGLTVYKSSGRGYTWDDQLTPLLITLGVSTPCPANNNLWKTGTGTAISAAVLAGSVALLYQKFIEQGEGILPNSLVMGNIIAKELMRLETVEYPNQSQGYGVLNREVLEKLLKIKKEEVRWLMTESIL